MFYSNLGILVLQSQFKIIRLAFYLLHAHFIQKYSEFPEELKPVNYAAAFIAKITKIIFLIEQLVCIHYHRRRIARYFKYYRQNQNTKVLVKLASIRNLLFLLSTKTINAT